MIRGAIAIMACFSAWAVVHSALASPAAKRWARRMIGTRQRRWYRLSFSAVAALTLFPLLSMVLLLPGRTLYIVPFPWRWITLASQALACVALLWTMTQTGPLHFAGLSQLAARDNAKPVSLQMQGFYRYVRHPLYVFSTIFIWLTPCMTTSLAALCAPMTLYFYLGSIPEEHKLLLEFGDAYAGYRERVTRFLPRLRPCNPVEEQAEELA